MTEYTHVVEAMKHNQWAEKRRQECNYLLAQDGYTELSKNNGSVVRTYHRDFGDNKAGDVVVMEEAMSTKELRLNAPSDQDVI